MLSLEKDISLTPNNHGLENITEEEAGRIYKLDVKKCLKKLLSGHDMAAAYMN